MRRPVNESLEYQNEQKSLNSVNNFSKEFRLMRKCSSYYPKNQTISNSVVKNESIMKERKKKERGNIKKIKDD